MRVLLLLLLLLPGCKHREEVKALMQADQAAEAMLIYKLPDQPTLEQYADFAAFCRKMATQQRVSIKPTIDDLKDDETYVNTSAMEAYLQPDIFIEEARYQAKLAGAESSSNQEMRAVVDSGISQLAGLAAIMGGPAAAAAIMWGKKAYNGYKLAKQAAKDETDYTEEAAAAKSEEELRAVQNKHYHRQVKNGTHQILYKKRHEC